MGYENTPFTLFISGSEPDNYSTIILKETPNILISYLYAQRKGKKFLKDRIEMNPNLRLIVDSGAHTFLSRQEEYRDKDVDYWEKYLEGYVKFARDNKDYIFAVVELDIDDLVGTAKVNEWREKYFEPLEKEGIQVCYVWHTIKGIEEWDRMCQKYSYIGFSYQEKSFSEQEVNRFFNSARKYKARVHGFACSGSEALTKFPFFTSDSSTWLIGTQYGEINFFDGRKMMRLKKDKWKRQFKNKLINLGGNKILMEKEDPYELQRLNILTLLELEKFVKQKMKQKMYWIGRGEKVEETEIERGLLPGKEWFDGECEDYLIYCDSLGIDKNISKNEALDFIWHFYNFNVYENTGSFDTPYKTEDLYNLADIFKLPGINTETKAIPALVSAFSAHAKGERKDLSALSTATPANARGKERDEYIEEDTKVLVDISVDECNSVLCQFLPSGGDMPEVEQYDEILKQSNIIPVRDEKGRLVKGQKVFHRPKKLYADSMPKMACNTCYKAQDCPDYKEGYVCMYNKMFKRFNTRNASDIMDALHGMVELNLERLQRMAFFEIMDGGMADPNVSALIDQNTKLLNMLQQMGVSSKVVAQRKTIVDENGRIEETTTVSANPQEGGILTKIFGSMKNVTKEADNTLDVEATEIEERVD